MINDYLRSFQYTCEKNVLEATQPGIPGQRPVQAPHWWDSNPLPSKTSSTLYPDKLQLSTCK